MDKFDLISDNRYRTIMRMDEEARGSFRAGIGAEAVKEMLMDLDLDALAESLKKEISDLIEKERDKETEGQKRTHAVKRLEVVEAFRQSNNKPEWMIMDVIAASSTATTASRGCWTWAPPTSSCAPKSACCRKRWTPSSTTAAAAVP